MFQTMMSQVWDELSYWDSHCYKVVAQNHQDLVLGSQIE